MRILITLVLLLFTQFAAAQVEAEADASSQFKILGRTFNPTFYSLASMETDRANDSGGRLGSYNYVSLHSFLSGGMRFSLRLPFTYGTAGTDRYNGDKNNRQEFQLQDFILEVRNPELAYLPWDMGLYWAFRIYTPNSKFSKQSGQIARFRNHFVVEKVFTSWLAASVEQRYYYSWQSRATYKTSFTDEYGFEVNDVAASTKQHELEHWVSLWAGKPKTAGGVAAIFEDTFYNKSTAENKSKAPVRYLSVGPEVKFPLNNKANFILVYADKVNREENMHELGQFLAKNTSLVLHSFISF